MSTFRATRFDGRGRGRGPGRGRWRGRGSADRRRFGAGARSAWAIVRSEALVTWRDRAGVLVPIALPLLIMFANAANPVVLEPMPGAGLRPFEGYLVPMVIAMVSAVVAVVNLPSFLATYRRTGILRTLSVTPVSPGRVLAAQYVVSGVQLLVGVVVMLAVAVLVFDLRVPVDLGGAITAFALGVFAMYGLGSLVAGVSPSPGGSVAIGLIAFLGTGALGGMFGPTDAYSASLRFIGELLPFGAMTDALAAAWRGDAPVTVQLVSLAVIGLVGTLAGIAAVGRPGR